MGVPKLKKKVELNYRRGGTNRSCSICNHFTSFVSSSPRCRIIGLESGRLYNINADAVDGILGGEPFARRVKGPLQYGKALTDLVEYLKRLKEGTSFQG